MLTEQIAAERIGQTLQILPLQVQLSQRIWPVGRPISDGETVIATERVWSEVIEGHAEFSGEDTIRFVRAAGDLDLAAAMLDDGLQYWRVGTDLFFERQLATAFGVGSSGSELVQIGLDRLDERGRFVAGLFAPVVVDRFGSDPGPPFEAELDSVTAEAATYRLTIEDPPSTGVFRLGPSGELRRIESTVDGELAGLPVSQQVTFSFDPLGEVDPPTIDLTSAEDVTETFQNYATERSNIVN